MSTTIGIDLGGAKTLAVRMANNEIVEQREHASLAEEDLLVRAEHAIRTVWAEDVTAIGVGVAGLVEWPSGTFIWGPHVGGTHIPVRVHLEERFNRPVVVDNDANTSAWGELLLGAARGYEDILLVTLGTGIGGAVVVDGQIYRGTSFAGEWGHVSYEADGAQCDCGKRGCWETVASGPALVRITTEFMAQNPGAGLSLRLRDVKLSGEIIVRAADGGDEAARNLVAQVGAALGRGLCNLIAVLDPEVVVVGGGLGSVGGSLLAPARRIAADAMHGGTHRLLPPILLAGLGIFGGAVGAALMAEDLATGRLLLITDNLP